MKSQQNRIELVTRPGLLQLTDCERLKVLGSQIESLIQSTRKASLPLAQMEDFYRKQFGYPLRPDDYGESNVIQVLKKLPQLLRVESGPPKPSTPPAATGGSSEETSTRSGPLTQFFLFLFSKRNIALPRAQWFKVACSSARLQKYSSWYFKKIISS